MVSITKEGDLVRDVPLNLRVSEQVVVLVEGQTADYTAKATPLTDLSGNWKGYIPRSKTEIASRLIVIVLVRHPARIGTLLRPAGTRDQGAPDPARPDSSHFDAVTMERRGHTRTLETAPPPGRCGAACRWPLVGLYGTGEIRS
jgi:hypothetical protein